jgi:hypothetical protein
MVLTSGIWGRAVAPRLASCPAPERWALSCGSTVWVLRPPSSFVQSDSAEITLGPYPRLA